MSKESEKRGLAMLGDEVLVRIVEKEIAEKGELKSWEACVAFGELSCRSGFGQPRTEILKEDIETDSRKLSNLLAEYLARKKGIKTATQDMTKLCFRYLIEAIGDVEVSKVGVTEAERFQAWCYDKVPSTNSCNSYCRMVGSVFTWAQRHGWIEKHPFYGLKSFKASSLEIRVFTPAEIEAILRAVKEKPLWHCRILFGLTAGLQRSEVATLTYDDLDFDKKLIKIRAKREGPLMMAWEPKDYEQREIPLKDELAELIKTKIHVPPDQPYLMLTPIRFRRIQMLRAKRALPQYIRDCPDRDYGRPFKEILKKAGVGDGCFHDLRKTFITELIKSGRPLHEIQKLAGHSNVETTMRYYAVLQ